MGALTAESLITVFANKHVPELVQVAIVGVVDVALRLVVGVVLGVVVDDGGVDHHHDVVIDMNLWLVRGGFWG